MPSPQACHPRLSSDNDWSCFLRRSTPVLRNVSAANFERWLWALRRRATRQRLILSADFERYFSLDCLYFFFPFYVRWFWAVFDYFFFASSFIICFHVFTILFFFQRQNCEPPEKSTLQHTAAHCSTLQHTAAHCSTLQHTAAWAHYNISAAHCNILQHIATHWKQKTHGLRLSVKSRWSNARIVSFLSKKRAYYPVDWRSFLIFLLVFQ